MQTQTPNPQQTKFAGNKDETVEFYEHRNYHSLAFYIVHGEHEPTLSKSALPQLTHWTYQYKDDWGVYEVIPKLPDLIVPNDPSINVHCEIKTWLTLIIDELIQLMKYLHLHPDDRQGDEGIFDCSNIAVIHFINDQLLILHVCCSELDPTEEQIHVDLFEDRAYGHKHEHMMFMVYYE